MRRSCSCIIGTPGSTSASNHSPDDVPLDLAGRLLPWRTRLRAGSLLHLHLHAWSVQRHAHAAPRSPHRGGVSRRALLGLVDSLRRTVERLEWRAPSSSWAGYETEHGYSPAARQEKERVVGEWLSRLRPTTAWDLGANTGAFSRRTADAGAHVVALDADPAAVELHYQRLRHDGETRALPLVCDLASPSPALGWAHEERLSLAERGPADLLLALALIHHIVIQRNVPLPEFARFLARIGRTAIVEFVPKHDPQVGRLLAPRRDVFDDYHRNGFEEAVRPYFDVLDVRPLPESERSLYLLRRT